jgi:DNA-binding NtrC family response regulator
MNDAARVLIVDDEPSVRLVFRTTLESSGYEVAEASDGKLALELMHEREFDVVLLDLRMPQFGGMETLERLREEGSQVPVVVVTAHGSIPDVVGALKLGAVDFVAKPLSPDTLRTVVREAALAQARSARPAPPKEPVGRKSAGKVEPSARSARFEEADFFLRVAAPLGVDPALVRQIAEQMNELRERRELGTYRIAGRLTWG